MYICVVSLHKTQRRETAMWLRSISINSKP